MIEMKEKAKEDKKKSKKAAETAAELLEFWQVVKARFEDDGVHFFDNIKAPTLYHMGFTRGRGHYAMVIGKTGPRVELYFNNDVDKRNFDAMMTYADELNQAFGGRLEWQRLENKKASRIKYEASAEEMVALGRWSDPTSRYNRVDWYVRELQRFYDLINPVWERAQRD